MNALIYLYDPSKCWLGIARIDAGHESFPACMRCPSNPTLFLIDLMVACLQCPYYYCKPHVFTMLSSNYLLFLINRNLSKAWTFFSGIFFLPQKLKRILISSKLQEWVNEKFIHLFSSSSTHFLDDLFTDLLFQIHLASFPTCSCTKFAKPLIGETSNTGLARNVDHLIHSGHGCDTVSRKTHHNGQGDAVYH